MKVLVACEFSGVVRSAFSALGHDAWSCDLLPTEIDGNHIVGDVLEYLDCDWDILIAHPPCTDLAVSGARYFKQKRENGSQQKSIDFFMRFINAPCNKTCVENPVGIMSSIYRKPDQIIQPYYFGEPESKATCLWLKNLKNLEYTNVLNKPSTGVWNNQTPSGQNKLGPSLDRAKIRSRTYLGIAKAMALQWSS